MDSLFNPGTLNIFCDASITKTSKETIGCPGSVAINMVDRSIQDRSTIIMRNSTNNESEIMAILMAIEQAIKYKHYYNAINIFSDSKISVYGLREWMGSWIRYMKDGVLYSSSNTPVANQQIFINAILAIVNNELNIGLYHQKGHINLRVAGSLFTAKKVFFQSNRITLTDEEAFFISECNDWIDNYTRDTLGAFNYVPVSNLQKPVHFNIDQETYDKFSSLVNY